MVRVLKRFRIVRTGQANRAFQAPLPGFDAAYYLATYPDVAAAGVNPMRHYLEHGWREGRDPSAGFSTNGYLAANPDVAQHGLNPLVHFLEFGIVEGREGWRKTRP